MYLKENKKGVMWDIEFLILARFYRESKETAFTIDSFRQSFIDSPEFNEHQREDMPGIIGDLFKRDHYINVLDESLVNQHSRYYITDRGRMAYENELKKRNTQKTREDLQDQLLSNSVRSNKLSPIFAGLAALFALASIVVSVLNYNKSSEKLRPQLQKIDTTLQQQRQLINNFVQQTKGVQPELHRLIDSLSKKP
jgi:hypothetical protein